MKYYMYSGEQKPSNNTHLDMFAHQSHRVFIEVFIADLKTPGRRSMYMHTTANSGDFTSTKQ